jgi:hypothetical protein
MILLNAILAAMMTAAMLVKPAQKPVNAAHEAMKNRYIVSAVVYCTDGDAATVEDTAHDDEWYLYGYSLSVGQPVTLICNDNGTPDDLSDDYIEDVLFCNDCEND